VRSATLAPGYFNSATAYQRVAAVYADNVLAHAELAKAYNFVSEPQRALETVSKAREGWPNHARLALEAGEAKLQLGDRDTALHEIRNAAGQMPMHLGAQTRYAALLNTVGRFDDAAVVYRRILGNIHPDYVPALVGLGHSLIQTGNPEEAARLFERALTINPRHRDSLFHLGNIALQARRFDDAAGRYRSILSADPDDGPARFNLAVALSNMGMHQEALLEYNALAAKNSDDAGLALNRAQLLVALHRPEDARAVLEQFLEGDSDHLTAMVRLHCLLADMQQSAELPRYWEHYAASKNARHGQAFLAWAYALAGNADAAVEAVQRSGREGGGEDYARWALVFLALRDDKPTLGALLDAIPIEGDADVRTDEHAAIIDQALATLDAGEDITPRVAFVLARRSLFFGKESLARQQLTWIRQNAHAEDPWKERTEALLSSLDRR
jgi:tetratricopeptide (TPR) repeat protein